MDSRTMAALAHLTAMDGGNAEGLQEQSLPCASRHLHILIFVTTEFPTEIPLRAQP
jgi:hypothetical protein